MRLFLAALLLPGALSAEPRQHGNVVFDLPQGWDFGGTLDDGSRVLYSDRPDEECEYCRIIITPGEVTNARADSWVAEQSRRFVDPDEAPDVTQLAAPELVNLKGRPSAMMAQKVDDDLQVLIAVQLVGRMELIAFTAPGDDEEDLAEATRTLERDVMPMLDAARFVSEGAAPLMPAPESGDLQGLWWGTVVTWPLGIDGMMRMEIDHVFLTFWLDGLFYSGTTPTGTAPFDRAARLKQGDMNWGSYQQDGDTLTLSYATGETETYTTDGSALTQGDTALHPVTPLPDGTKLDGTVSTVFYSGFTPGSGLSGGMSAASDTRFHPDGRWEFSSVSGASANFDAGGGFATSGGRDSRGTYEVRDGQVIRTDETGKEIARDFIHKDGSAIWIGSNLLE